MNTQNTELSDKISWSAPVQDIQNLVTLKAQADAKMTAATTAYNNVIATTAKSSAAPKLEAEADDVISDANKILNGLKAEDDAKDKKVAAPASLDEASKDHSLASRRRKRRGKRVVRRRKGRKVVRRRKGRRVVRRRKGRRVTRKRVVRRRRVVRRKSSTRYYGVGLFKAKQSSIYGKTKKNIAYPIYGRGGQHTNKGNGQWWMAYFRGGARKVTMVKIWNRRNCCGARIRGALVKVGNQVCGRIPKKAATKQVFTIKCKKAIRGNSVKVQLTRSDYLHLHKIQVFASDRQRRVVRMRRTIKKSGGRKIVINVRSAGYKAGNYARIYFNGKLIRMRYGRGLNIVAWDQKNMRRIHA